MSTMYPSEREERDWAEERIADALKARIAELEAAHAADAASLAALRREKESAENDWQTCDENLRHERLVNRQLQAEVSRLQQALTEAQQERDEARRMAEERSDVLIACMVEGSECAMEYLAQQPKAARLQSFTPQEPR